MMQICFILLCWPLVLMIIMIIVHIVMSLLVSIIVMIHLVRFRLVMIAAQAGTRPVVTAVRIGHHLTFNYYLRLCKAATAIRSTNWKSAVASSFLTAKASRTLRSRLLLPFAAQWPAMPSPMPTALPRLTGKAKSYH